jgi:hypothetical protein
LLEIWSNILPGSSSWHRGENRILWERLVGFFWFFPFVLALLFTQCFQTCSHIHAHPTFTTKSGHEEQGGSRSAMQIYYLGFDWIGYCFTRIPTPLPLLWILVSPRSQ